MGSFTGLFTLNNTNITDEDNIEPIPISKLWLDDAYGDLLGAISFLVAIILIFVLMLMTKRKKLCPACCNGYYSLIVPVNFLEDKKKRKIVLAACALMALDIVDMVQGGQDFVPKDIPKYAKVFVKVVMVAVTSVQYLPLLRCIYVSSLPTCIIGFLYAALMIATAVVSATPNPNLPMEYLVDDLILRSIILLISGGYVLYWFLKRSVKLAIGGKSIKYINDKKYEIKYVKNLLISQRRRPPDLHVCTLQDKSKLQTVKQWFRKHIYYNVSGFKYSLTILVSCTIGFLGITKAATKSMATAVRIFIYCSAFLEQLAAQNIVEKIPNFVKTILKMIDKQSHVDSDDDEIEIYAVLRVQVIVVLVALLSSVIISYILSCVLICRLLVNYRSNVLSLYKSKSDQDVLPASSLSNITLVLSAIQYMGYQIAYLISGFIIQSGFLLLVFLIVCEIVLFPIQFAFNAFFSFVLQLVVPILIVLILIKGTQSILVRFAFLEDRGKTLAIANRRAFFITMYVVFFYNVLTGFVSCIVRIVKCALIGVIMMPRLDSSLFPKWFAKYDSGFKSYSCLLHLEALQCNPILRTFVTILLKRSVHTCSPDGYADEPAKVDDKEKKMRLARNRWFVAVTLIQNPILVYQRRVYLRAAEQNNDVKVLPVIKNVTNERETVI